MKIRLVCFSFLFGLSGCMKSNPGYESSEHHQNGATTNNSRIVKQSGISGRLVSGSYNNLIPRNEYTHYKQGWPGKLIKVHDVSNVASEGEKLLRDGYTMVGYIDRRRHNTGEGVSAPSLLLHYSGAELAVTYWQPEYKDNYDKYGNDSGTANKEPTGYGALKMSFWSRKKPEYANK